eukprot:superscaffoldBa00005480_g20397
MGAEHEHLLFRCEELQRQVDAFTALHVEGAGSWVDQDEEALDIFGCDFLDTPEEKHGGLHKSGDSAPSIAGSLPDSPSSSQWTSDDIMMAILTLTMASMVALSRIMGWQMMMQRNMWLYMSQLPTEIRQELLDGPICPTGFFGLFLQSTTAHLHETAKKAGRVWSGEELHFSLSVSEAPAMTTEMLAPERSALQPLLPLGLSLHLLWCNLPFCDILLQQLQPKRLHVAKNHRPACTWFNPPPSHLTNNSGNGTQGTCVLILLNTTILFSATHLFLKSSFLPFSPLLSPLSILQLFPLRHNPSHILHCAHTQCISR